MFHICSHKEMTRIDEASIAEGILAAPGWARLGITEPKAELRIEAATELARAILARVGAEDAGSSAAQPVCRA